LGGVISIAEGGKKLVIEEGGRGNLGLDSEN